MLQCVSVCRCVLLCVVAWCGALQCVAARCSVLRRVAQLQCVAVRCSALQCVAVSEFTSMRQVTDVDISAYVMNLIKRPIKETYKRDL